jgi:trans-AT polyketide synthase, acyltransferase and oxidoreductase domains
MSIAWMFPGQGAQHRGMGAGLFDEYPQIVAGCDAVLGLSIRELCLEDPGGRLADTRYAQPALFLVNALTARRAMAAGDRPDIVLGHSLGEFNALEVAGAVSLLDAFALVVRRGRLMSEARDGAMAAVVGATDIGALLADAGATELEVANLNSPSQVVVSGSEVAVRRLVAHARATKRARVMPLSVSAAFHSRHMEPAAAAFEALLRATTFREPSVPVIANVTGTRYPPGQVAALLARHMRSQVRWWESLMALRRLGVSDARQCGPGDVLTRLWSEALAAPVPHGVVPGGPVAGGARPAGAGPGGGGRAGGVAWSGTARSAGEPVGLLEQRGAAFCAAHGVRAPYVAGSMYRAIASVAMVVRMARAGLLGYLGTGGLSLAEVDDALTAITAELGPGTPYGVNVLSRLDHPHEEERLVDLCLRHDVRRIEAAAFTQVTAPIVQFRFHGASVEGGRAHAVRHVLAKVSRREVAEQFMRPPPDAILRSLRESGRLSAGEEAAARRLPVSADVCVEADSGGHTDAGVAFVLVPVMVRLRDEIARCARLDEEVRVGAAGGIGTPEAIAAACVLGAQFVVSGSVNQCTPEAGTSTAVKDLLACLDVSDTTYAPAGDLFELGSRVQVVRKGTLFAARANYLYQCYRTCDGLEDMDGKTRQSVERYLGRGIDQAWEEACEYLRASNPDLLARARQDPKVRMARVFKTYFARTVDLALRGDHADQVNFQVHCGPAMGAVNAFARGTDLQDWQARHVDVLAGRLIDQAGRVLHGQR